MEFTKPGLIFFRMDGRKSPKQYAPSFFLKLGAPGYLHIILYQLTKFEAPSCFYVIVFEIS